MKHVLTFLFFLSLLSSSVVASPSWFKPGVYLAYYARDPSGHNSVLYLCNGTEFLITGISTLLVNFSIEDVSYGRAKINVSVFMNYSKNTTLGYSNLSVTFLSQSARCNFWGSGEKITGEIVSSERNGMAVPLNVTTVLVNHPIVINGTYFIEVLNGSVYARNGKYIGHTALWGLRGLKPGSIIKILNDTAVTVLRNDIMDYDVITYWRVFQRPNGQIITNWSRIEMPFYTTEGSDIFYYNPSLDILEVFLGSPPDLAAIGVLSISANDVEATIYNEKNRDKLVSGKLKIVRPVGLSLYDSNIHLEEKKFEGTPPKSPWLLALFVSLFLSILTYWRVRT
jgi:hypothetical protein